MAEMIYQRGASDGLRPTVAESWALLVGLMALGFLARWGGW